MRPLYIFDLDGTLALIDHRRPILDDTSLSKDERWRRFFAACVDDKPNEPVVEVFRTIAACQFSDRADDVHNPWLVGEPEIWIWSARSNEVEAETRRWLEEYVGYSIPLKMRQSGDHTPDIELKQKWLNGMSPEDRKRLVAVFDDRRSVVDMYRRNGICVFQCADGIF